MLVSLVVTVIVCCIGSGAFTPQPQHDKVASTNIHIKVDCSTRTENDEAPRIERIRAAVFQPPAPSDTNIVIGAVEIDFKHTRYCWQTEQK